MEGCNLCLFLYPSLHLPPAPLLSQSASFQPRANQLTPVSPARPTAAIMGEQEQNQTGDQLWLLELINQLTIWLISKEAYIFTVFLGRGYEAVFNRRQSVLKSLLIILWQLAVGGLSFLLTFKAPNIKNDCSTGKAGMTFAHITSYWEGLRVNISTWWSGKYSVMRLEAFPLPLNECLPLATREKQHG